MTDWWNGWRYKELFQKGLFHDPRDLGLTFNTDRVLLFCAKVNFDSWPILLQLLNLPLDQRALLENLLLVGHIPGPNEPKELNSFLNPLVEEFEILQSGISGVYDGYKREKFTLQIHICVSVADSCDREKVMMTSGTGSYVYCPTCMAVGIKERSVYCPFTAPKDQPPAGSKLHVRAAFTELDILNLPLQRDTYWRIDARLIATRRNVAYAKSKGINGETCFTWLNSLDFPRSFPPGAFHLFYENIIPNLFNHMRGRFFLPLPQPKGKDGNEKVPPKKPPKFIQTGDTYCITAQQWKELGNDMETSWSTFPSAFGEGLHHIDTKYYQYKTAE